MTLAAVSQELVVSGVSVGTATLFTNPFDVLKTRLQLQRLKASAGERPPGLIRTGALMVKNEGLVSLWNGLPPALARGFLYGGMRLGLYPPVKAIIASAGGDGRGVGAGAAAESQPRLSFVGKLLAGSVSGGFAAAVTNPAELVKTRLQTKGNLYTGSLAVIRDIVKTEGIAGLWRGAVPGMSRAAMVTACQCGTYDEIKAWVVRYSGWGDSLTTHLTSSILAGLVATTVTNPIDVIKTVIFVSGNKYSGPMACAFDVLQTDGPAGFFKGWAANFARLGPQTVITFIVCERIRSVLGMKSL